MIQQMHLKVMLCLMDPDVLLDCSSWWKPCREFVGVRVAFLGMKSNFVHPRERVGHFRLMLAGGPM